MEGSMKRGLFLAGICSLMLVFGFMLTGCDTGNGGNDAGNGGNDAGDNKAGADQETPATGSITIKNTSGTDAIVWVTINDATTGNPILDETASIAVRGGSKTYTVDPGKYTVTVTDETDWDVSSTQFQLAAGGSKVLTFTGVDFY
jgi:zona occludens toxin (predicted ATPase)